MKKSFLVPVLFMLFTGLIACNSKKETPSSLAKKWCALNAKITQAPDGGPQYGRAKEALAKFEADMDKKYGKDEKFMDQVEAEIEKCEDASEGRK